LTSCPSDHELADLADAPATDPRRAHVDACPRCRARLADFAAFVRDERDTAPAELAAAERTLAAAVAARLDAMGAGTTPASAQPQPPAVTPLPARPRRRVAWTAWAAAAAFAVSAGWLVVRHNGPVLERGTRATAPARDRVVLLAPLRGDGAVTLRWQDVPGADRYVVRFVGADLVEVARSPGLDRASYVLERAALPTGLARGTSVLWQVVAFREGERVAASEPATLRVP